MLCSANDLCSLMHDIPGNGPSHHCFHVERNSSSVRSYGACLGHKPFSVRLRHSGLFENAINL